MDLSEKIKIARKNKNLTQTQLARIIGVRTPNIISSWESGQSKPTTMSTLKNLCDALDLTPCDLLNIIPTSCNVISSDDKEILSKLRYLDSAAKDRIREVVDAEYARCTTPYTSDPVLFQIQVSYPIFLVKEDPDYAKVQHSIKDLKKRKREKKISAYSITKFLWMIGYNGHISIAQVCAIFLGALVPSQQLYNCITSYIDETYKVSPNNFFNTTAVTEGTNMFRSYIEQTLPTIEEHINGILQEIKHSIPFSIHMYMDQLDNIWITLSATSPEKVDPQVLPPSNAVKIAYIRLYCSDEEICLDRLAVHPVLQGHGLGTILTNYAKEIAHSTNVPCITVHPSYGVSVPNAHSSAKFLTAIFGAPNKNSENTPKKFYTKSGFVDCIDDSSKMIFDL